VRAAHRLREHWSRNPREERDQESMVAFFTSSGDDRLVDLGVAISTGTLATSPLTLQMAVDKVWEGSLAAAARGRIPEARAAGDPDSTMVWESRDQVGRFIVRGLARRRLTIPVTSWSQVSGEVTGALYDEAKEYEGTLHDAERRAAFSEGRPARPEKLVSDDRYHEQEGVVGPEDLCQMAIAQMGAVQFNRDVIWATMDKKAAAVAFGINVGSVTLYRLERGTWKRFGARTARRAIKLVTAARDAGRSAGHAAVA
jgi:hypothetical protein